MRTMTCTRLAAAGAVIALCAGAATAYDYDFTLKGGKFDTTRAATLVKGSGGNFNAVRVWCPYILDEIDAQLNAACVQRIGGNPVGAVTSFLGGVAPASRAITILGTVDSVPAPCGAGGPTGSNDIILEESTATSNSMGTFLPDGTLVFRENFAGTTQNNLAFETGITGISAQDCFPDEFPTNKVFGAFCGIDALSGAGSAFLSTPGALRNGGALWVGNTTFNNGTTGGGCGAISGVGVWAGTGNNPATPFASWLANATVLPTNPPGTIIQDVRQTPPVLRMVNRPAGGAAPYIVFGVGFSASTTPPSMTMFSGGSARPLFFVVDEISGGGGYDADSVYIEADKDPGGPQAGNRPGDPNYDIANTLSTSRFIDHQATGAGAGPFVNSQYDMNAKGEIVTLWEDLNTTPRVTQIRLYRPIWNGGGTRIIGYQAPIVISDNVADAHVVDLLQTTGPAPTFTVGNLVPYSGVSIADNSTIAYAAVTEKNEAFRDVDMNPVTPDTVVLLNTTNGLYVVEPTTGSHHELVRGGQTGTVLLDTSLTGPQDLHIGVFPVDTNSDGFNREGLSRDGTLLAANFRDGGNENGVDQDTDGFADLGGWLKVRGSAPGVGETSVRGTIIVETGPFTPATPACPGDINGDRMVGLADIAEIITCWSQPASCNPAADLDGSGSIGLGDVAVVISNWATVCP